MATQADMFEWCVRTFGMQNATSQRVRALRFLEEAIELGQALGLSEVIADALMTRVYAKEKGDIKQEFGGVYVTLNVLAESMRLDLRQMGEAEFDRCKQVPEEKFRQRNKEKDDMGFGPGIANVECTHCGLMLELANQRHICAVSSVTE